MNTRHLLASACLTVPVLLALLLGGPRTASAQGATQGSIYSRFGLGERNVFSSSMLQGMGGGGTALNMVTLANFANPAAWGDQILTRVTAGMLYEGLTISDAADNTSQYNTGSFNALQISFPLYSRKMGVGLSFSPYSRVNYQIQRQGLLTPDAALQDTSTFVTTFTGSGGLHQVTAGLGYKLGANLSLGASVNFLFGIIEESQRTSFIDDGFADTNLTRAVRLSGISASAGALVELPDLFRDDDVFSVGATVALPTHLSGDRVQTLGESLERDTLGTAFNGDATLPVSFGFGLAYRFDGRWTFVADGTYEPWSTFESDFSFPGYTPGAPNAFDDRFRVSAGIELLPAGRDILEGYFMQTAYRLGFYYDQAYASPNPDVDIRTLAITGGFGLPTMVAGTRLDLNWEVGKRGTTTDNLVRDRYYRIGLNVNFGERWFNRRRLR